jgi:signal transduction histidine kinase/DNA-binding response OmpR family regulator
MFTEQRSIGRCQADPVVRGEVMQPEDKVNILLVDDQPGNLTGLQAVLECLGQNLVLARSGKEALRCLLREEFALILLDVHMPGMDGLETAALIRDRERTRHVPIIFLTGYEQTDVQMFRGYSLGAVDYLTKPIVPDVLRSKVSVFVDLYQKTEQVRRQAEQLRQNQQREHERQLLEEKQRWEMERLREEATREKKIAEELARTVAERVKAEEKVREQARQQALVADLGRRALAGTGIDALLDEAVALVANTLAVEFCLVLETQADGETLLLRSGVGWREGSLGRATIRGGSSLLADDPLMTEDLAHEAPLADVPLLREHSVAAGLSVPIRGGGRPYGVLGAYTSRRRTFGRDEVYFLQTVAHVLAAAVQRWRNEQEVGALKDELARQLADMTRLQQLSARLSRTLELPAVQEEVLAALIELQHAGMGVLLAYSHEQGELSAVASVGLPPECLARLARVPVGVGVCGAVLARRGMVVIEDVEAEAGLSENGRSGSASPADNSSAELAAARQAGYRAVCGLPLLTRGGAVIGAVATYFAQPHRPSDRDLRLAELYARQAAEALDNARLHRAIQEANRGKDEFLAMLAHELRNPLAPILNSLHVMRLSDNPAKVEASRDMAERQVRHMTRLIDDLLDVSRITRGKIRLRREPIELAPVIQQAVESTRSLIESRGHHLEVDLPAEPIHLLADATRLEQVLSNLLNNAAKYTEPGGHVWLTARREGAAVLLSVRDTGMGIPPAMLSRVFDLFMQGHATLDRSQGGLGIGLTLVRSLVEMHDGSVEVHSEGPGKGSEFIVRLPALTAAPARGSEEKAAGVSAPTRRALRVLVVDDNRDAVDSLALMLQLDGHEVHLAHDGPSALEMARTYRPEVVLLDIGLPGMSGYEVARHLRGESQPDRFLLVAMTGYGQDEDRRRSREAGFDHHLVKPVDPADLRELLARS